MAAVSEITEEGNNQLGITPYMFDPIMTREEVEESRARSVEQDTCSTSNTAVPVVVQLDTLRDLSW